jgi:hypothetical protein
MELPLSPAANLIEFREIQKFTAAVRKLWPGAVITLRPNSEFTCEREDAPSDLGTPMTDERIADGNGDEATGDDASGI